MKKYSMHDIKVAVPLWFSEYTMRFFDSRVDKTIYHGPGGVYFVSSEQFHSLSTGKSEKRMYSVRQFHPETDENRAFISTASRFNELDRQDAIDLAMEMANPEETDS